MMGAKARQFRPVLAVSLDELVPADHFYRHLERVLDLSLYQPGTYSCLAVNSHDFFNRLGRYRICTGVKCHAQAQRSNA
jgi:hypothetical protein